MSSIGQPSGLACGNCGTPVTTTVGVCPSCGVLLAAYQSIAGAEAPASDASGQNAADTPAYATPPFATKAVSTVPDWLRSAESPPPTGASAPTGVPEAPTPPASPPPVRPVSRSPIGDAMRRSHAETRSDLGQSSELDAAETLADMASGEDELAAMASGQDELARMAAGDRPTLAEQVEAELKGAHVTFSGAGPAIEAEDVTIAHPGEPNAAVDEHPPPTSGATPPSSMPPGRNAPTPITTARAAATPVAPQPGRQQRVLSPRRQGQPPSGAAELPHTPTPPPRTTLNPRDLVLWVPLGLMVCVLLGVGRNVNGTVGFFLFIGVMAMIWLLTKTTKATSRKTTSMPKDTTWTNRRR